MSANAASLSASFARIDDPRLAPPESPGIRIAAARSIRVDAPLVLQGIFVISEAEHAHRSGTPHRDLALTVHREPFYACVQPFRDNLVFSDDVVAAGDRRIGWFTLDVWACCGFRAEGVYYLRVSLGEKISPHVLVEVGG